MSATYKANCHCGNIRYTVEVSPPLEEGHDVVSCNCSICVRNGLWHIYIPKEKISFIQGEDKLKEYRYLTIVHAFCPDCSTSMMAWMADPDHEWASERALNVRAFQDVDFEKLNVKKADMKDKPPKYKVW